MNKIFFLLIAFLSIFSFGQTSSSGDEDVRLYIDGDSNLSYATFKEVNVTEGDFYLFKDWVNDAKLYTKNKKRYVIAGLNYNLKDDGFEVKMRNDSVFVLDANYIDHINVNGRIFKKENTSNTSNNIYEILLQKENKLSLLKKHKVRLVEGKFNPLDGVKQPNRYYKFYEYYILDNGNTKKITLKRKEISPIFEEKVAIMKEYIKTNKLSYKKEKDVIKMLKHFNDL